LAAALADDASFASTVTNNLATKATSANATLTGSPTLNGETMPKVFQQTTAPTSGMIVGDFWYDTDDDIMSVCGNIGGVLQWIGI